MRERNKASQAVFAAYLNTSVSTIQKWERGEKKPNGPSLKLLSLVETKGLQALAA
jgi:putative transcriptional regulator